tara:strand:- start:39238 stop:40107 length:870 start_codon:yes stop_codon:yes gene_type:complete
MKWTNNYNLPEPLVKAVVNDKYSKTGWISTTQLIDSPQVRQLKYEHRDEIEEDVVDAIWALFGSATHSIIERAAENCEDYLSEIPLEIEVLGKALSGTADLYDKKSKTLYDFKVTSVWNLVLNDDHWQWEAQLNTYAYMLREAGYEVDNIKIIAILKDWKKSEVERNYSTGKYPPKQIGEVDIKMYSQKAMLKYIEKRMQLHLDAVDGKILECNERERWARPSTYAIKDPSKKRALKVCNSEKEAEEHRIFLTEKKGVKNLIIEVRRGTNARCEGFCPVSRFCEQYRRM